MEILKRKMASLKEHAYSRKLFISLNALSQYFKTADDAFYITSNTKLKHNTSPSPKLITQEIHPWLNIALLKELSQKQEKVNI